LIVFELICGAQHRFEGWFASVEDYDGQHAGGLLSCPSCGTADVRKLLTAKIGHALGPDLANLQKIPSVAASEHGWSALIDHVLLTTEDVGKAFAAEARRIHAGVVPARGIRGLVSSDDSEALIEEGIQLFSLPIPEKQDWH
jgi:hypothetical protein